MSAQTYAQYIYIYIYMYSRRRETNLMHVYLFIHRPTFIYVNRPANVSLKPVEVVSRARRGTDAQFSWKMLATEFLAMHLSVTLNTLSLRKADNIRVTSLFEKSTTWTWGVQDCGRSNRSQDQNLQSADQASFSSSQRTRESANVVVCISPVFLKHSDVTTLGN